MSNKQLGHSDIVIVGGGMVGSCLALALAKLNYRVSLIEPYEPIDDQAPGFDARAIALSRASAKILNSLGLWQELKKSATPIKDIHISDKGRPGMCRLNAAEANIPAMGYVIELEQGAHVLHKALQQADIKLHCPARVTDIKREQQWIISIEQDETQKTLSAPVVIAADGGNSSIRDLLHIKPVEKAYEQKAIISTISSQLPHQNKAFERFTDKGPVALLPLSDNRISLVWMLPPDEADTLMSEPDQVFLTQLQATFGYRLGRIERVGQRYSYPLVLRQTMTTEPGVFFIGNAAQSLHPIAGQGFNLGLRDVADLVDVLADAQSHSQSQQLLTQIQQNYEAKRAKDKQHIIDLTDTLARLFANPSPLVSLPRNILLGSMSLSPLIRHEFGRFAMGLNHPAAKLTRGLALSSGAQQ